MKSQQICLYWTTATLKLFPIWGMMKDMTAQITGAIAGIFRAVASKLFDKLKSKISNCEDFKAALGNPDCPGGCFCYPEMSLGDVRWIEVFICDSVAWIALFDDFHARVTEGPFFSFEGLWEANKKKMRDTWGHTDQCGGIMCENDGDCSGSEIGPKCNKIFDDKGICSAEV